MTVAAANANWLPRFLSLVGKVGTKPTVDSSNDAPQNALLLSTILSTLYILFGSFRALLTFNGLGEYSFFFLTVVGAIVLRWREPGLQRPYKPIILIPVIFAVVSGFVVIRGAIFAPVLTWVLVGVWFIGAWFYWVRMKWRREAPPVVEE